MAISPRTQSMMQQPPTEEDARQAFEAGFSDMAYNILSSKFPEIVGDILTFKVIKADVNTGSAVGAFIVSKNGSEYIVPAILANNQLKPLEVLYAKEQNIFLPLKSSWLNELDRMNMGRMGEGVKAPKNLASDVDIRNLVVPPATGRYSYASATPGTMLTQFLSESPNSVKEAFAIILEKNPKILKFACEKFDYEALLESIRPEPTTIKTASLPNDLVDIFTTDDSAERFREVFGDAAANAFQKAAQEGYAVKDKRLVSNVAISNTRPVKVTETKESGFYRVQFNDGSFEIALVVAHPASLSTPTKAGKRTDYAPQPNVYTETHKKKKQDELGYGEEDYYNYNALEHMLVNYMVYTESGKVYTVNKAPVGEKVQPNELTGRLKDIATEENSSPLNGYGFFVCTDGGHIRATEPLEIVSTTTASDGTRRIRTDRGRLLVTHPDAPGKALHAPEGSEVTYIPASYIFVKAERDYGRQLTQSAEELLRFQTLAEKNASYAVKVNDAGADMFYMNGAQLNKLAAFRTLVKSYGLRADAAEDILTKTAEQRHHAFWVLKPMGFLNFVKEAQGAMVPQNQQMPQEAPGTMPPMGGTGYPETPMAGEMPTGEGIPMDGSFGAMEPAAPPPPSPVDLAVVELSSELAQQSADVAEELAKQQRDLSTHLQILEAVKQRADQIAGQQSGMFGDMGMSGDPQQLASSAEPYMDQAADLEDPDAFESTAVGALASSGDLPSLVANYMPNLEEALDNLGRILLSLWMTETETQKELGELDYADVEEKLRNVFNNLGNLILRINQVAMAKSDNDEAIS